jgi:hypothetical protein
MSEMFAHLSLGFGVALTFKNIALCFTGCLLGTLIGVLPGLGPLTTIAMLLPITYALSPDAALIMLAGIYYGAQYGGSTTAIVVNLPGESSSVVTTIDGYQMARQGRAGVALSTAAIGSFFAGCVATLAIAASPRRCPHGPAVRPEGILLADDPRPAAGAVLSNGLVHRGRLHDRCSAPCSRLTAPTSTPARSASPSISRSCSTVSTSWCWPWVSSASRRS